MLNCKGRMFLNRVRRHGDSDWGDPRECSICVGGGLVQDDHAEEKRGKWPFPHCEKDWG